MPKSRKPKKVKFPSTITVMVRERDFESRTVTFKVMNADHVPQPDVPQICAIYKLVGVEKVTSKLVVTRKQVSHRK